MREIPLPATGLRLTEAVFGLAPGGGTIDAELARLDEGWQLGARAIVTTNAAGGAAERLLGRWLDERQPEDALVVTSVGGPIERGQDRIDLSPAHLGRQLPASAARLGRLDVALTAGPDEGTPIEATVAAFGEAIGEGRIGAWGLSGVDAWQAESALAAADDAGLPRPVLVANRFNLLHRDGERDLLPLLASEGVPFVARAPLQAGTLTDRFVAAAEEEAKARPTIGMPLPVDPVTLAVTRLRDAARERSVPAASLALAWLRAQPLIAALLVSPVATADWDATHEAFATELDDDERDRIAALVRRDGVRS